MTDDIVRRLRWDYPRKMSAALMDLAADEIERLRAVVEAWKTYSSRAERDIAELRAERDEARRRVCANAIHHGRVYRRVGRDTVRCETAKEVAEMMGWDCFKEDTDGR